MKIRGRVSGGGYNEPRILYSSPLFDSTLFSGVEERTIHIGIDLFTGAGKSVYAPIDGEVFAFCYNLIPSITGMY
ncbi:MAG: hypothetical protein R2727_05475 [Bacteroidales bacterium]